MPTVQAGTVLHAIKEPHGVSHVLQAKAAPDMLQTLPQHQPL